MVNEPGIRKEIEYREQSAREAYNKAMALPYGTERTIELAKASGQANFADGLLWVLGEDRSIHDEIYNSY